MNVRDRDRDQVLWLRAAGLKLQHLTEEKKRKKKSVLTSVNEFPDHLHIEGF